MRSWIASVPAVCSIATCARKVDQAATTAALKERKPEMDRRSQTDYDADSDSDSE